VLAALSTPASFAAERLAMILTARGMPLHLERVTFFDEGRQVIAVWRNSTRDVLYPRLLVFAFDESGRFAGGLRRCSAEPLQPGTRAQVRVELEVPGVTSRWRLVALVEEVRSIATIWRTTDGDAPLVEAASRALNAERVDLDSVTASNTDGALSCECDCDSAEAAGRASCGSAGLAAFTCTPIFFPEGCAQAYACRQR
jgi:hypothetical protein